LEEVQGSIMSSVKELVQQLIPKIPQQPQQQITMDQVQKMVADMPRSAEVGALQSQVTQVREALTGVQGGLADSLLQYQALQTRADSLEALVDGPAIIQSSLLVSHRPIIMGIDILVEEWKTKCGWHFGHSVYTLPARMSKVSKNICGTCYPEEKRKASAAERQARVQQAGQEVAPDAGASSSSSESSSSSDSDGEEGEDSE